jgi:hypothetical protein
VIIYGHKYDLEFRCNVPIPCPDCGRQTMQLVHGKKKFTLYWIPTFTMSEGYFLKCSACKTDLLREVDAATATELQQLAAN